HIIVLIDRGIALRKCRPDIRLFDPVSDIKMCVVPQYGSARIEMRGRALYEVDESGRSRRYLPVVLRQQSVDYGSRGYAVGFVARNVFIRARDPALRRGTVHCGLVAMHKDEE